MCRNIFAPLPLLAYTVYTLPCPLSSKYLILLNFFKVATLGAGKIPLVKDLITSFVSSPEILITEIPEIPGPEERANIVIFNYYSYVFI